MRTKRQIEKELYDLSVQEERKLMRELREIYKKASDRASEKIHELLSDGGDQLQSKIYQARYQSALRGYLDEALETIQAESYEKINAYLNGAYNDGFLGAIYSMQAQGVPLIFPPDARQITYALMTDSKLSKPLYETLGINLAELKEQVRQHVAMGIASGESWAQVAWRLNNRMDIGYRRAMRIARTEGHRVQAKAALDSIEKAKDNGADVLMEWNSAGDNRVRPSHRHLHGQLREVGEYFEVNGHRAKYPGGFGIASEDINCRCRLSQRARWAVEGEKDVKDGDVAVEAVDANTFRAFKKKCDQALVTGAPSGMKNVPDNIEFSEEVKALGIDEHLELVNPKYSTGDWKWTSNCQRCVPAYEARRRGLNVTAKAIPGSEATLDSDPLAKYWYRAFERPLPLHIGGSTRNEVFANVEEIMANWGDGARAELVMFHPKGLHAFVAERVNGRTEYLNPQNPGWNLKEFVNSVLPKYAWIMRMDNLEFSNLIAECIKPL